MTDSRGGWDRLGTSGSVWERLGASGSVWKRPGASGSVWKRLGTSGSVWERMPMTPPDYSRDEDASEETSNDDCNEWFEAFEGHAPANSPMVRMPPVANAKGKGKAKGKTNAKAKGKAKGEAKVRPAGRLKPKRKANASVVIDTSPTTPPLPLKVCTRGMRANLKIGSRSCRFLK